MIKTTAAQNTLLVEAWVVPSEIGFLNALIEEYEGMAMMRTLDRKEGHLKFWVPTGQTGLLYLVFDDLIDRGWMYRYEVVEPWWEISDKQESGEESIEAKSFPLQ